MERPRISLCLIARDGAQTLPACLESVRPYVDQIVGVVDLDTLADRTAEILREYGGEVHHWAWNDDFSAARNESLRHATGDWLLWLDCDDRLENGALMVEDVRDAPADLGGFVMRMEQEVGGELKPDPAPVHHKLFRRRNLKTGEPVRFVSPIHEFVYYSATGGRVEMSRAHVVHTGYDPRVADQWHKWARNIALLLRDDVAADREPQTDLYLAREALWRSDYRQALARAERYLEYVNGLADYQDWKQMDGPLAYNLRTYLLLRCQEWRRFERLALEGVRMWPHDRDAQYLAGVACYGLSRFREARDYLTQALSRAGFNAFNLLDRKTEPRARALLALTCQRLGDQAAAREWSEQAA